MRKLWELNCQWHHSTSNPLPAEECICDGMRGIPGEGFFSFYKDRQSFGLYTAGMHPLLKIKPTPSKVCDLLLSITGTVRRRPTSASIIVPTARPLISRILSPTWMAFRTSGLRSIPLTLGKHRSTEGGENTLQCTHRNHAVCVFLEPTNHNHRAAPF